MIANETILQKISNDVDISNYGQPYDSTMRTTYTV